jgi:hypothetical protein
MNRHKAYGHQSVCVEEKAPPCIKDRQTDINIEALFCFERRDRRHVSQADLKNSFARKDIKKVGVAR